MPTIRDVASRAGVSVATVSAVINSDSGVKVSKELTSKVEKAIRELNYRPNRIAQALSRKQTRTIAYVVPTVSNAFFSQIAHHIEDKAFARKYGVYLCNTHSKLDRVELYKDILIENKVAGVVVTLTWDIVNKDFIKALQEENIPIVGLAGARISQEIDTVTIDDLRGGEMAAQHLIKKGHNQIGFIGIEDSKTTEERLKGYLKALNQAGIKTDNRFIELGSNFSREEGYRLAEALYRKCSGISAIFVYNDVMAAGVIDRFNDYGISIPEEVAIVGYDNSIANYTRPKLTTLDLSKKEMVEKAIDILFKRIEKEDFPLKHERIIPELIVQEST